MTTLNVGFVTATCCHKGCNLTFAMTSEFYTRVSNDGSSWYCPLGHGQHYTGKSDAQKLQEAQAREVGLQDQLSAAIRDAEGSRVQLLRISARIANGVCPCCNRSFDNVRRHVASKHPDFALPSTEAKRRLTFECSCGRTFESFRGLRTHQGHVRETSGRYRWDAPKQDRWYAHLTKGASV